MYFILFHKQCSRQISEMPRQASWEILKYTLSDSHLIQCTNARDSPEKSLKITGQIIQTGSKFCSRICSRKYISYSEIITEEGADFWQVSS